MSNPTTKPVVNAELGYDRSEPHIAPIIVNIISILIILIVVIVGVDFYFHAYRDHIVEETQLTPVSQDLLDLHAKEDQALNSYGIADKAAGTVRLPVARAMELVLAESKEGKPKYPVAPYAMKKVEDTASPGAAAAPAAGDPAPAK